MEKKGLISPECTPPKTSRPSNDSTKSGSTTLEDLSEHLTKEAADKIAKKVRPSTRVDK